MSAIINQGQKAYHGKRSNNHNMCHQLLKTDFQILITVLNEGNVHGILSTRFHVCMPVSAIINFRQFKMNRISVDPSPIAFGKGAL